MAIYTMRPVIDVDELEDAVNQRFGCEIAELANLLFGDEYYNDSYKCLYYDRLEVYRGRAWENEEKIRLRNLVYTYLKEILPDYDSVLVNLSW